MEYLKELTIGQIAAIIRKDWLKINFAAKPYLDAMKYLDDLYDSYGYDSGRSIVSYFLSNAGTWRGPTAKAIKSELKSRIASN